MPSSTAKRVSVYRFDRQPFDGFVNPATFLSASSVEILSVAGAVQNVGYPDLKAICFVDGFGRFDLFEVNRLFERRPRIAGLWTRFTLRDGDQIDGILPHNLQDWPYAGYLFVPPRASTARQRVFIPREALLKSEFQGVIGAPASRLKDPGKRPGDRSKNQLEMFD